MKIDKTIIVQYTLVVVLIAFVQPGCTGQSEPEMRWYKGNLHTHSLWSDGDHFPEAIADWYRQNEYDFLAISDHNTVATGVKWVDVSEGSARRAAFEELEARFGEGYSALKDSAGRTYARLSTFDEYTDLMQDSSSFLMIRAEEITDHFGSLPIHINASNIQDLIAPQGGTSVQAVMQRNLDAVAAQRRESGVRVVPHINHPNFGWGITAEDLAVITGDRLFEVYNGHPSVRNDGDSTHYSTEEIWDIVLAARLGRGNEMMYGIATDDAHHYHERGPASANPGRGWVNVRTDHFDIDHLMSALEDGQFYASSGVELTDVWFENGEYGLQIDPEPGVSYQTTFVVSTLPSSEDEAGELFRDGVGVVVATDSSLTPTFRVTGNEMYVRATVTSTKVKENPYSAGEFERAWTQPVRPR